MAKDTLVGRLCLSLSPVTVRRAIRNIQEHKFRIFFHLFCPKEWRAEMERLQGILERELKRGCKHCIRDEFSEEEIAKAEEEAWNLVEPYKLAPTAACFNQRVEAEVERHEATYHA